METEKTDTKTHPCLPSALSASIGYSKDSLVLLLSEYALRIRLYFSFTTKPLLGIPISSQYLTESWLYAFVKNVMQSTKNSVFMIQIYI